MIMESALWKSMVLQLKDQQDPWSCSLQNTEGAISSKGILGIGKKTGHAATAFKKAVRGRIQCGSLPGKPGRAADNKE